MSERGFRFFVLMLNQLSILGRNLKNIREPRLITSSFNSRNRQKIYEQWEIMRDETYKIIQWREANVSLRFSTSEPHFLDYDISTSMTAKVPTITSLKLDD